MGEILMNLKSCDDCGVVIDIEKVSFPYNIQDEDGYIEENSAWNGDKFVAKIKCPVCNNDILES